MPVFLTTWKRHAGQIARGERERGGVLSAPSTADKEGMDIAAEEDMDNVEEEQIEAASEERGPAEDFAIEVAEMVARNRINVTGAQAMLKTVHRHFNHHLPADIDIPPSWYIARKLACEGKEPEHIVRDFCPKCDYMFDPESDAPACPLCFADTRYDCTGSPERQAYYFPLDDKCARWFAQKFTSDRLLPPTTKPPPCPMTSRELCDPFDGSILSKLHYKETDPRIREYTLYFAFSSDGVEVEKKVSYTPITAKVLNLPNELRGLLSNIWLLG